MFSKWYSLSWNDQKQEKHSTQSEEQDLLMHQQKSECEAIYIYIYFNLFLTQVK